MSCANERTMEVDQPAEHKGKKITITYRINSLFLILQVILEDSNGENITPWQYDTISIEELQRAFIGATGGLRLKSDNSALRDEKGIYQLQKEEIYVVVVPQREGTKTINCTFFFISFKFLHLFLKISLFIYFNSPMHNYSPIIFL